MSGLDTAIIRLDQGNSAARSGKLGVRTGEDTALEPEDALKRLMEGRVWRLSRPRGAFPRARAVG